MVSITNQPNALATAQGNLSLLEMRILNFATAVPSITSKPDTLYQQPIADFFQIYQMNRSGDSYDRVCRAFDHLKEPILNLPDGRAPLFGPQSSCKKGILSFQFSKEIQRYYQL